MLPHSSSYLMDAFFKTDTSNIILEFPLLKLDDHYVTLDELCYI
jgi:hypothetical protein